MKKISLRSNDRILFIGDSITDTNRLEVQHSPLGWGYVYFAANLLIARKTDYNFTLFNRGISGDTTRLLKMRWQKDCLALEPDVLSILIGINDLWRRFDTEYGVDSGVSAEEYEDNLRQMLMQVREKYGCRMILMQPFMFNNDTDNEIFSELRNYVKAVDKLVKEFDAAVVPLQDLIDSAIENISPQIWSEDTVHPYPWAHAWIAERWLEVIEFD